LGKAEKRTAPVGAVMSERANKNLCYRQQAFVPVVHHNCSQTSSYCLKTLPAETSMTMALTVPSSSSEMPFSLAAAESISIQG